MDAHSMRQIEICSSKRLRLSRNRHVCTSSRTTPSLNNGFDQLSTELEQPATARSVEYASCAQTSEAINSIFTSSDRGVVKNLTRESVSPANSLQETSSGPKRLRTVLEELPLSQNLIVPSRCRSATELNNNTPETRVKFNFIRGGDGGDDTVEAGVRSRRPPCDTTGTSVIAINQLQIEDTGFLSCSNQGDNGNAEDVGSRLIQGILSRHNLAYHDATAVVTNDAGTTSGASEAGQGSSPEPCASGLVHRGGRGSSWQEPVETSELPHEDGGTFTSPPGRRAKSYHSELACEGRLMPCSNQQLVDTARGSAGDGTLLRTNEIEFACRGILPASCSRMSESLQEVHTEEVRSEGTPSDQLVQISGQALLTTEGNLNVEVILRQTGERLEATEVLADFITLTHQVELNATNRPPTRESVPSSSQLMAGNNGEHRETRGTAGTLGTGEQLEASEVLASVISLTHQAELSAANLRPTRESTPSSDQQLAEIHGEHMGTIGTELTAEDVVNIVNTTGRIVQAIEAYSRSPDPSSESREAEFLPEFSVAPELSPELQERLSVSDQQVAETSGSVSDSRRQVTEEDMTNIYVQACAIVQSANSWLALSDSARSRAISNININANWGNLLQGRIPREASVIVPLANVRDEPLRQVETTAVNQNPPDNAVEQSGTESSQDQNAKDSLFCPICMEPWTNTGEHRICSLACGHLFGKSCIKRWIRQCGRRLGKCPHCNKRAKVEDLRNIYVPHISVIDEQGYEAAQEVKRLKADNEQLKLMNDVLMERDRLHRSMGGSASSEVPVSGACDFRKVDNTTSELVLDIGNKGNTPSGLRHTVYNGTQNSHGVSNIEDLSGSTGMGVFTVHARTRQPSNQVRGSFVRGESLVVRNVRHSSSNSNEDRRLDGENPKGQTSTIGLRSNSSLAYIGNRGLGENFILQDEVHLLGAKVFDMDAHSQMILVSNKAGNHGSNFGLTKMSLLTTSDVETINLWPGLGAIRDIRFSPTGIGAPGKLALVASLGRKLSLVSLQSNSVVLSYSVQSAPWSCAWDLRTPNQVYAGLQNGSLLTFDLRQTSSPIASWNGSSSRPVHTLQTVQNQSERGLLSASSSGAYFWDMGSTSAPNGSPRPYCISDSFREKLCVSLAYESRLQTAVASFRPSPLAQTEASSSASGSFEGDNLSQPAGNSSRPLERSRLTQPTSQGPPSHCIFNGCFEHGSPPCANEGQVSPSNGNVGPSGRHWRWEAGEAMVSHKSISVMPRSSIIVEPLPDVGLRSSFVCGDEGTNAVWLWDMNTRDVVQTLVPHQSPVLDVKYVNIGDRIFIGCISEKTFQLYRRPSSTVP